MKLQPNILIRQKELKPVNSKGKYYYNDGSLGRLLRNIKRYTTTDRILICAAVSPDNSKGVFLDDKGHEYLITSKDLDSDLKYISSKFIKKQEKRFVGVKRYSSKYNLIVKKYLSRPDAQSRYKDWIKSGDYSISTSPKIQINEEIECMNYEVGKCYLADDGDWSFKVLAKKKDYIQIQDLSTNKKYKVEVSDLDLSKPDEMNESVEDSVSPAIKKLTGTLKAKCDNIDSDIRSIHDIAVNLKENGRDYDNGGVLDRLMIDSLIQDAKKTYNYYLIAVKAKLKDISMSQHDTEYIDNMIENISKLRTIDMDNIDLDELKNMF